MPASRRLPPRAHPTLPAGNIGPKMTRMDADIASANSSPDDREHSPPMAMIIIPPKHAHIPDIPTDSHLLFELMLFVYGVMAMCLQYINLYKTVWWLPHSHANYALNFYLIDPFLVLFLVLVTSRRLVWCFVHEVQGSGKGFIFWLVQMFKLVLVVVLIGLFFWSTYQIIMRHSFIYSLFLCYPLVTYIMLFGLTLKPLFDKSMVWPLQVAERGTPKHKVKDGKHENNTVLWHNCSMSPETVREEVEILKTEFNNRIKQVLFNSMLCAYYMGFIPLCFAQNTLYYDTWWVGQHVCLIWVSVFIMFMVHFLPPKFVDMLHRCALHLGRWVKVEGRHAHVPYNAWSELQVWQKAALVKHVRGLFKAEGVNNSAEPGNTMHTRFYFVFHSPLRIITCLLVVTWALVIYQFFLLVESTEWAHIISLAFLLFCNYYSLFKLMRDRLVLTRSYKEEQQQQT